MKMKFRIIGFVAQALVLATLMIGSAFGQELVRVSEAEARKQLSSKVDPEYPPMAKQMRLSGRVQVDCFIDQAGNVEKVQIVNGNALFTSAINSAMKKWKFRPIEANGKATSVVASFVFDFKL